MLMIRWMLPYDSTLRNSTPHSMPAGSSTLVNNEMRRAGGQNQIAHLTSLTTAIDQPG
jgi:hypothetical protein